MSPHLAILLLYAALLMAVGLWVGRRVHGSSDFFVAGRRLGPGLIFATLLAANLGAGTTVNAAGLAYRDGLSAWWWVGSAGLGSLVLAFWVGPRLRQIAAARDLHTVGDFLEHRYGREARAVIASLLWVGSLGILAGQLIAMGFVLNAVTGLDRWVGSVIGGIVVAVYFTAGGLLTSVWVNAVQLVVLLLGFIVAVPMILTSAGGLTQVFEGTREISGFWSVWRNGESGWFYLAMLGPSFILSPGILQRVYAARDDRAVRLGVGVNGLALLVFAVVFTLLGMIARMLVPDLPDQNLALPTLLLNRCRRSSVRWDSPPCFQRKSARRTRFCSCWRRLCRRTSTIVSCGRTQTMRSSCGSPASPPSSVAHSAPPSRCSRIRSSPR